MIARAPALLFLLGLLSAAPGPRADDLEDALEGFEADELQQEMDELLEDGGDDESDAPALRPRWWDLTGAVELGASHSYAQDSPPEGFPDYRGLSRLQAQLSLQLDLELPRGWEARIAGRGFRDYFYAIEGRSDFPGRVLDTHQSEKEFQELWLRGSLRDDLDLKFGRQIIRWGRSDNLRVIDVLNPIDRREPGLVNVEDLKLPVVMTRLDYYRGPWTLQAIVIHESRFDTAPVPGSEFFAPGVDRGLPDRRPGNGGGDTEWALRLRGIFSGWDVSMHWARYFNDQTHAVGRTTTGIENVPGVGPVPPGSFIPDRAEHARLTLWGVSGQIARGNWLFKSELAYIRGLRFFEANPSDRSRLDAMVGVEYAGITDVTIAFEVVNRYLDDYHSRLEEPPNFTRRNRVESSLLINADFLHDTLHATFLAIAFGAHVQDGALLRAQLEYDLRDALSITGGIVVYQDGDLPPFSFIDSNDRVFLEIKYSF